MIGRVLPILLLGYSTVALAENGFDRSLINANVNGILKLTPFTLKMAK